MSEIFMIGLILIAAWFLAGVVNYLADVLPHRRRLDPPFCLECGANRPWWQIWLPAWRCTNCGKPPLWRYWAIQLLLPVLSLALWDAVPGEIGYPLSVLTLAYLVLVTVIDIEHHLILHVTSLFGSVLGGLVGGLLHGWQRTLIGGVVGFLIMLMFFFFGLIFVRMLSRLRGQPLAETEGLGFGDVFLGGVIGLFLGWQGILVGLLLAILMAGAASAVQIMIMLIRRRYILGYALPYGPFMTLATLILLFWGEALLSAIF